MTIALAVQIALIVALVATGLSMLFKLGRRSDEDVLLDLLSSEIDLSAATATENSERMTRGARAVLTDKYGQIGLFSHNARRRFDRTQRIIPIVVAIVLLSGQMVFSAPSLSGVILSLILGLAGGYLFAQSRYRRLQHTYIRSIEFFLPIIMERIVMAVQSGLDIIPALQAIFELDAAQKETNESPHEGREFIADQQSFDPVSRLLRIVCRFTEAGLSFEQSLREVAEMIECSALRHSFIHLAVAQQEGGELVMPLRELSDSTQLYFQESVEEEIAAMPIKATMPLLCTFAGLIVLFITSPMIQVLTMTAEAIPK